MGKYKYLLKNIGLLTISNFSSKLLSFILVPLYTSVLSTHDYGTYDLLNTTINLLLPLLTLNIFDSVLRFSIDKKDIKNRSEIFSYGCKLATGGSAIIIIIVLLNNIFKLIPVLNNYGYYIVAMFMSNAFIQIFSSFARGIDRINDVAIAGILATASGLGLNIFFLLKLNLGLRGYFLAGILSSIIACIFYFVKIPLYKYITFHKIGKKERHELLGYSIPMMVNTVGWWINSLSDRYIVSGMCGIQENGIYSVGYKIPSILNLFVTVFSQAWTLSAVKEFDSNDTDGFFSNLYTSYNTFLVLGTSLIICSDKLLAKILYAKDFYIAWKYVPYLTMASMFGALAGYLGGIFAAQKDSKGFSNTTIIGAFINISLNVLFVLKFGAMGAAVATLFSYIIVWGLRLKIARKYVKFKMKIGRDLIGYLILLIQSIAVIYIKNIVLNYIVAIILFCLLLTFFKNEITKILSKFNCRGIYI